MTGPTPQDIGKFEWQVILAYMGASDVEITDVQSGWEGCGGDRYLTRREGMRTMIAAIYARKRRRTVLHDRKSEVGALHEQAGHGLAREGRQA